jgi:DNA-binding LacI/PurR family transcriptional regulator
VRVTERRGATMKDIAERVGVSKMTVSAVLSGTSGNVGVSAATRERVLTAARQLRYRPNALARSLRSKTTHIIGLYSGYHYLDPRNAFYAEIVGGLQEGCIEYRKDLLLHSVFRGDSVDDIYSSLVDGRIDGLVMTAPCEDPLIEPLAASHLPVVVVADAVPSLPSVLVDDAQAAALTLDYLAAKGHRRLVYRSLTRHLVSAERRRAAYFAAARERGLAMEEWCAPDATCDDDSWSAAWLARSPKERPTAVLCWNDKAAFDVFHQCRRHGIRVPEELAITGFDDIPNPAAACFRLTTIRAPWSEVARLAVRLLVAQIGGEEAPRETVLPVKFVPGNTA